MANHIIGESLVISSDTELCRKVSKFGVSCLEVDSFVRLLNQALIKEPSLAQNKSKVAQKASDYESTSELDALMHDSSKNMVRKDEQLSEKTKNSSEKALSKYEKKIYKLIKKL